MTSAEMHTGASEPLSPGTVEMKLEVVIIPVSDVDRAKAFYQSLGWRLDADLNVSDVVRIVQLTPTGSNASKSSMAWVRQGHHRPDSRAGSTAPLVRIVRLFQRSGSQSLAAAGNYAVAPWPLSRRGYRPMNIPELAELLRETAEHHDPFEKSHAAHNWWDWYAAYMYAREQGSTPDAASASAARYMDGLLNAASHRDNA